MDSNPFGHSTYLLRKQFFKLFGGAFRIYDTNNNLIFFSEMKAFKLKEDIRVYSDESKSTELLTIKARHIIDISAAYDVTDAKTFEKIGTLKRRGLKSVIRDEWIIMNQHDQEIGKIEEDNILLALLRRFITALVPQSFLGTVGMSQVFKFTQHFDPFVQKITLDFSQDYSNALDRRLGIAAAILISAIEGRQSSY